jgi:hypothetical protein
MIDHRGSQVRGDAGDQSAKDRSSSRKVGELAIALPYARQALDIQCHDEQPDSATNQTKGLVLSNLTETADTAGRRMARLSAKVTNAVRLIAFVLALMPGTAFAHNVNWFRWDVAGREIHFRANLTSFTNSGIARPDIAILQSVKTWNEHTAGNAILVYDGDCPNSDPSCHWNTVADCGPSLVSFEYESFCGENTTPRCWTSNINGSGVSAFTHFNLGVCGDNGALPHSTGYPTTVSEDLWQTLAHEFGHVLNLDHSDSPVLIQSIMASAFGGGTFGSAGSTKYRSVWRHDVTDLESMWGTKNYEHVFTAVSSVPHTSWSSLTQVSSTVSVNRPGAADGWQPSTWYPMAAWMAPGANINEYSVTAPTTTQNTFAGEATNGAIQAGYHVALKKLAAVWQRFVSSGGTYQEIEEHRARLATSLNGFIGYYSNPFDVQYTDGAGASHFVHTLFAPSVSYDYYSQRYFLAWTNDSRYCTFRDTANPNCEQVSIGGTMIAIQDNQLLLISSATGNPGTWEKPLFASATPLFTGTDSPTMSCENSSRLRNCIVCVPGTDMHSRIWCVTVGFSSAGTLAGVGPSITTPYYDNAVSPQGIAWGGGTSGDFLLAWKSNSGTNIMNPVWTYVMTLTGSGDISWGSRQAWTDILTRYGPSITTDDVGDNDAQKRLVIAK